MMDQVTIIGIAASVFTATSLIPQLVKLLKTKESGDLSLVMLGVLFTGLGLWTCYGWMKNDWIITVSNAFSMLVNGVIIVLTIRYCQPAERKFFR